MYIENVYYQFETTNQSFIDMHEILKSAGIQNNKFFLMLLDSDLAGVDPFDENLSREMKIKIWLEVTRNRWYYLREIVRIPSEGNIRGKRYELNLLNLSQSYLHSMNFNYYSEGPRQFGKTVGAIIDYSHDFNFASSNSKLGFLHKDHTGSKDNLNTLRNIINALPPYLRMDASYSDRTKKKLKKRDTVEVLDHIINGNRIITFPQARSEDNADNMGRGMTLPSLHLDEFGFMKFIDVLYAAIIPAVSKAKQNAAAYGSPYGINITSTPGNVKNESGKFANRVRQNATRWELKYFDYTYEQLQELISTNELSNFFYIRFTYKELGAGEEYLAKMFKDLEGNWAKFRRDILLEWNVIDIDGVITKERISEIERYKVDIPINKLHFGKLGQYVLYIYKELTPGAVPIIGVDVAGGEYQDASAITIIDSNTTDVVATFKCNYISFNNLGDMIVEIVQKWLPNAVINIERNGGFGKSVIERIKEYPGMTNHLYYEFKDRVIEENNEFGSRISKSKKLTKVYCLDSSGPTRKKLIDLLFERVENHKHRFISPMLIEEFPTLVANKKTGKVGHDVDFHDDQTFSYLMALYVWYFGEKISDRFNIQKRMLLTDNEVDDEVVDTTASLLEKINFDILNYNKINIDEDVLLPMDNSITYGEFEESRYEEDMKVYNNLMNKLGNDNNLNNFAFTTNNYANNIQLPQDLFNSFNNINIPTINGDNSNKLNIFDNINNPFTNNKPSNVFGNMADDFMRL